MQQESNLTTSTPVEQKRNSSAWLDAWHTNPSLSKEYDAIDGLRGVAILMVVACHLIYVNPTQGSAIQFIGGVFGAGTWGVTIFFTLSGFLISHPFWKRKVQGTLKIVPRGYAWRRFWKIYPPLALSILLLTPFYIAMTKDSSFLITAAQWLIGGPLLQPVDGRLNPVMWSLIVEIHFYLLLPLLFLCTQRAPTKLCLSIIFLILLCVPTGFRWWQFSHGTHFELHPKIAINFPSLLDAFAFGVLLAGLENLHLIKKSWARLGDIGIVLLIGSFLGLSWFSLHPFAEMSIQLEALTWAVKIASAMMLCYIADPANPRSRFLSQPWLRWCGLISYEWYLFHQPILLWMLKYFGPTEGNILKYSGLVGGALVLGLALATIIYRFFSLPILKRQRNKHASH